MGVEKFNREEEKKEQAEKPQVRSSLKERLAAKQRKWHRARKIPKNRKNQRIHTGRCKNMNNPFTVEETISCVCLRHRTGRI